MKMSNCWKRSNLQINVVTPINFAVFANICKIRKFKFSQETP